MKNLDISQPSWLLVSRRPAAAGLWFRIDFFARNGLKQSVYYHAILRVQALFDHELLTDLIATLYASPPNNILTVYDQNIFALLVEAHRGSRDQKCQVLLRRDHPDAHEQT